MSRPSTLTSAISKESLVSDIRYFAERFQVAEENSFVTERLLLLIQEIAIGGKQIHDANIVATMQIYKIDCILTHNVQDFNRFSRLLTVLSLQE
jgi:predicted nucleic acid-binding protein